MLTFYSYQSSRKQARDLTKKADLNLIAIALGAYKSENGKYPASFEGMIAKACGCGVRADCGWGLGEKEFCDTNNIVYLKEMPYNKADNIETPKSNKRYCYVSDTKTYKLYANLEYTRDPEAKFKSECNGFEYNYGVSSANTTP